MKKAIFILGILALVSCEKEQIDEPTDAPINIVIPSTLELTYSELAYPTLNCIFNYTDVNGNIYSSLYQMDRKVENVDFTKPFSVSAQAGLTTYPVGQPPQQYPQTCTWVLKKDGYVIDSRITSSYTYTN